MGNFLRGELDFYIKNEVLHLDDIEHETVPRVDQYLSKIKVIRKIAHKVIQFLEQLENYQRRLWLKKKFVVETNYCITLDRIPEELYPEVAANDAQREEWVRLFAIDKIEKDLNGPGYSKPLTVEFLKSNLSLVLDTRFFSSSFAMRVTATLNDIDAVTNGVIVGSDNRQMLRLVGKRYRSQVKCIYIDPPYNLGPRDFIYKDNYQTSSWATCIHEAVGLSSRFMSEDACLFFSIGLRELGNSRLILDSLFDYDSHLGTFTWKARVKPVNVGEAQVRPQQEAEYVLGYELKKGAGKFSKIASGSERTYPHELNGRKYRLATILKSNRGSSRRETMRFEIEGYTPPEDQRWQGGESFIQNLFDTGHLEFAGGTPMRRYFEDDEDPEHDPFYCYINTELSSTSEAGKSLLNSVLGNQHGFDTVKPIELVSYFISAGTRNDSVVMDYFAGSGTTGHAVINLNRVEGNRKYLLAEMGNYCETLLKPRLLKAIYSTRWRDGKPTSRDGISQCVKYIRLESYDDALNNLEMKRAGQQTSLLDQHDDLREQYILSYMLDVESRGSQSLLNVESFCNPDQYKLRVERNGETQLVNVDLIETFNWLIGLTVHHLAAPQCFEAKFKRDSENRMTLNGRLKPKEDATHWFRTVTGTTPDGRNTLVIWRKRPGGEAPEGVEQDNLVLDEWFTKQGYSSKDSEFDLIYVNGTNNLENLRTATDTWKVRLIEEDFHRLMFEDTE